MTEFLVVLACSYGSGCNETSRAYYESKPELQNAVKRGEWYFKRYAGPTGSTILPIVAGLAAGQNATITVGPKTTLTYKPKEKVILWSKEF